MPEILVRDKDSWADLASRSFVPVEVTRIAPDFIGTMRTRLGTHTSLTNVASSACTIERARTDAPAMVFVALQTRGATTLTQGRTSTYAVAGRCIAYRSDRPYRLEHAGPYASTIQRIPRDLLPLTEAQLDSALSARIPIDDVIGRTWSRLVFSRNTAGARELAGEERVEIELLGALLGAAAGRAGRVQTSRAQHAAMLTTIEDNLDNPRLNVAFLARQHHLSERGVHAIFARERTTPAYTIRQRRAQRALGLLQNSSSSILEIAALCGFTGASSLRRAINEHFDTTPTGLRQKD